MIAGNTIVTIEVSEAVIERAGVNWPDTVMLRLHLKGLEHFTVTNGKVTRVRSAYCALKNVEIGLYEKRRPARKCWLSD